MAEKKPEEAGAEAPAPKKKTKLFIIIGVAVLVLVLVGVGATLMLSKKKAAEEDTGDEPAKEEKAAKKEHEAPPVYVKLEQFTVQLQPESRDAYLQTTVNLRMLDAPGGEAIKQFGPSVRNRVLMILVAKKPSEVSTPQGMQTLAYEIRDAINAILGESHRKKAAATTGPAEKAGPDDPVQEVLFESFIIQ